MGTAVLLPQDCLPASKSRHKPNFTDVLYGSSSSTRARGGTFHTLDSHALYADQSRQKSNPNKRAGWNAPGSIPLPEHGQALTKNTSLQRELDGKKPKARRPTEARDLKVASKPGPDVPVFTILQRPKDKELANELIVKFLVKVDESKPSVGLSDAKADVKVKEGKLGNGIQNAHLKKRMSAPVEERPKFQSPKLDVSKLQCLIPGAKVDLPTIKDSKEDGAKFCSAAPVSSKPVSVAESSGHNRLDDLLLAKGLNQMLCSKDSGKHKSLQTSGAAQNFSCKFANANLPAGGKNLLASDIAHLRHALTDPQIGKHVAGQYRSAVMEIPCVDARSLHGSITRSSSMSCPERWAGPAYSSSPAPSSLPLPKFSRANQKLPSSDLFPLPVEGCNAKVAQFPVSGSGCALPGVLQGGGLDVASATRSLRRMLKLEPC